MVIRRRLSLIDDVDELKRLVFPLHERMDVKYNWLTGYQRALKIAKYDNDVR